MNTAEEANVQGTPEHASDTRLNWLRAAVLGANDGIVSIAALVVGIAGASTSSSLLFLVGIAGTIAGALSMAVGEFVSVSSQRDIEKSLIDMERTALESQPEQELKNLAAAYESKGLSRETAQRVAEELTAHDALAAHVDAKHRMDAEELTNPWHAGIASAISYTLGGCIPLIAIVVSPLGVRVPVTFVAVLVALVITGYGSAKMGKVSATRAIIRVVIGGMIAMIITYGVGRYFGVSGV